MARIIELDLPDIVPASVLNAMSPEALQMELANIAEAARNHWIGLAGQYLHTTRASYIRGIQKVQLLPGVAVISLVGTLPHIIERGMSIVDLRDWLLGPGVPVVPVGERGKHRTEDGEFYRAIPFRHQTPGSSGTQAPRMGDPYRGVVAGAKEIGRAVYRKARRLKTAQEAAATGDTRGRLPPGLAPKLKKHHKTDIYQGMIKTQAAYSEKPDGTPVVQTGGYFTFRTISTRETGGWIRPPTLGRHFAERTQQFIARLAPRVFAAHVEQAVGGSR